MPGKAIRFSPALQAARKRAARLPAVQIERCDAPEGTGADLAQLLVTLGRRAGLVQGESLEPKEKKAA